MGAGASTESLISCEADFRAAHGTVEFRDVVTAPGWEEFPSSPVLFEVVTEVG